MATPQVFVSHSHADNDYCRAFVAALRQALGDDDAVWYDEHNLGWGALRQVIDRELQQRQHFIAILSPAAVASKWVNREIDAALALSDTGSMQAIQFVIAAPCQVSPLLQGYKRIEQAGGAPYPPQDAARKAQAVITAHRVDPPPPPHSPSPPTTRDTLPPPGPAPAPALLLTPTRLYNLGYRGYTIGGVECILPPVCPVPEGGFTMGSDRSRDNEASGDEMPQYPVALDAFAIGQHPVTVAEYACAVRARVVRKPPKSPFSDMDWAKQQTHPDHPVVYVNWHDALAYVRWLAQLTKQPWRLPSEAEWEKAARGTDARIYPWGDTFDNARCNTNESGFNTTTSVGSYPNGASPHHAQDMTGNVWEWTSSLFQPYPYRNDDGREHLDSTENRVLRGGSWAQNARYARATFRDNSSPGDPDINYGFRLALASPGSA